MINIEHKEFLEGVGAWYVQAHVELSSGIRRCTHMVELGQDASDDEIKAAILALYQPTKGK